MRNTIKSLDDLPVCLNVSDVAQILRVSRKVAYKIIHQKDFPSIRVGEKRIVIPRDKFIEWMNRQTDKPL
jgi:excisionase family DNA binding protein